MPTTAVPNIAPVIKEALPNLAVYQHKLHDGTFVDIPVDVFPYPPPKPAHFLHLQHFYDTPSSLRQDLKGCANADEAIDVLVHEIEGMRTLLQGYVHNFRTYVDKYDDQRTFFESEIKNLQESYYGLEKLARNAEKAIDRNYAEILAVVHRVSDFCPMTQSRLLAERSSVTMEDLKLSFLSRPPQRPLNAKPKGQKKPNINEIRETNHKLWRANNVKVATARTELEEVALMAEVANPLLYGRQPDDTPKSADDTATHTSDRQQQEAQPPAADKPKEPLDPLVSMKVEKVAETLDSMREALQRTRRMTELELLHLRNWEAREIREVQELDSIHNASESQVMQTGRAAQLLERYMKSTEKWIGDCFPVIKVLAKRLVKAELRARQDAEAKAKVESLVRSKLAAEAREKAAATAPSSSSPLSAAPAPTPAPAPRPPAPTTKSTAPIPIGQNPASAPTLDGDIYAVCLELKCEKSFDELTRDEAIDLLKSLPLRTYIMPHTTLEEAVLGAVKEAEAEESEVEEILSSVGRGPGLRLRPVPRPAEKAPAEKASADIRAPVAEVFVESASTAGATRLAPAPAAEVAHSRKRSRDGDEDVDSNVGGVSANVERDPAGGSPAKRARQ